MFSFKKSYLCLLVAAAAPVSSFASNYCIAVNNGFGSGGTTFVGPTFALPAVGTCSRWSGFAKTASTVIMTTDGVGCLSSDGKVLTFSLSSVDPSWLGTGQTQVDYIYLCSGGATSCAIGSPRDIGNMGGPAKAVTCTSSLLTLPAKHD